MRRIASVIICEKAYQFDFNQFDKDVYSYFDLFFKCFINNKANKATITFKQHHMVHYTKLMRYFGPLILQSTLKYERLHQTMINIFADSKNSKDIPQTTIKFYSTSWMIDAMQDQTSSIYKRIILKDDILNLIDPSYQQFINQNQDLIELKEVTEYDIKFRPGFIFVYYSVDLNNNNLPLFVKISKLFSQNNKNIILGNLIKTINFDKNSHFYIIDSAFDGQTVEISPSSLTLYRPLISHSIQKQNTSFEIIQKDFHFGYQNCHAGIF